MLKTIWNNKILYGFLSILTAGAALMWWIGDGTPVGDFGLNALVELLSIVITILIVETLLIKRRNIDNLPITAAMYRDIQLFFIRIAHFWSDVHFYAVPGDEPSTVEELFSTECFEMMLLLLNLDANPPNAPSQTWWTHFSNKGSEINNRGQKILDRYFIYLDPEIFRCIHLLVEGGNFISGMNDMTVIRQHDQASSVPRPRFANAYFAVPEQVALNAMLELYRWCEENFDILSRAGHTVYRVSIAEHGGATKSLTPLSMMPQEELRNQVAIYSAWQESRARQIAQNR